MKFLLDQDVYAIITRFLIGLGHDVVLAAEMGMSEADAMKICFGKRKKRDEFS